MASDLEFIDSIRVHVDELDQPPDYPAPLCPSISVRSNLNGEAMELSEIIRQVNVDSDEEHPMLTIDIRPRGGESEHEHPFEEESSMTLLMLCGMYIIGTCIAVLLFVFIVLLFFPNLLECIMGKNRCFPR